MYVVRINGEYTLYTDSEQLVRSIMTYTIKEDYIGHCMIYILETEEIIFETLGPK